MMIWLALYLPAAVAALFLLWAMFVIVMTMEQLRDAGRLSPFMVTVGESIAAFGLVWDVLCNVLVATVIFLEPPFEATISARLRRLVRGDPTKWRTRLAIWFATVLMNPFCPTTEPHIPFPQ